MGVAAKERELEGSVQGYLAASGIAGHVSAAVNAAVKARAAEPCSFMVRPPPPPPPPPPPRSALLLPAFHFPAPRGHSANAERVGGSGANAGECRRASWGVSRP